MYAAVEFMIQANDVSRTPTHDENVPTTATPLLECEVSATLYI